MSVFSQITQRWREFRLKSALRKIGKKYVAELKNRLAADGKVVTGDLEKSIKSNVVDNAVVITANSYLDVIDKGKKPTSKNPSTAMVSRIARWMQYKGIRPRGFVGLSDRRYRKAAFGMAKSINRKGFKGSGIIMRSYEAIEGNVRKEISESLKQSIEEMVQQLNIEINKDTK